MINAQSGSEISKIDKATLDACVHCGLCLPACPTYLATGRETESPRGRIYLITLAEEGTLDFSPRLIEHIDSCLGCLGCQTVCPSGVNYERILNGVRPKLREMREPKGRARLRFVFAKVLPNYPLLRKLAFWLRAWQRLQGRRLVSFLHRLSASKSLEKLQSWESYLPEIPKYLPLPRQSWSVGAKRGNVQLFQGCVMDVFYNNVNHSALRLLHKQSQIVEVPEQTCCGALALHAGEIDIALELARRNIQFFDRYEGPIVVTSAGCGAMLKMYPHLFEADAPTTKNEVGHNTTPHVEEVHGAPSPFKEGDDRGMAPSCLPDEGHISNWVQRARSFSARVRDLSEFLAANQFVESVFQEAKAPGKAIAYHAACHLVHAQKISEEPERLLRQLLEAVNSNQRAKNEPLMRLVPLEDAEHCCGSAGIYNLQHEELSEAILAQKIAHLKESGADIVVTSNPGCLLQIEAGVKRASLPIRVLHIAQLLDEAYQKK
jgi:glycolate oxidase iron-sulfur subunit